MPSPFTEKIIETIRAIPEGRVCTYGTVAALAGNRRGARQVSRVLHSSSRKENLPWHRVINREGRISLDRFQGYEEQKRLLLAEGVSFDDTDRIDLVRFGWRPIPADAGA
ncbi:Methylated-DNA-(protein)-cysteine S-methyltransferase DNA binding protein [Pseudodesulfovibrio mercurii]|uniref:Methylated-DNA-(Protein)-cysteine S-methyltransferase DNA binding protein n=1 Tax=Pseudodesulfovibrio mercurii TaxID=641491 RepID=F0JG30_9BACT|nr:MGMT family protein [Pseudodesulfovibrio mercurii]EGB13778.1 Methylated-DNA-(protein)-cysteine S-methyltransferase DNA binding protein [Pseudodesulfovibrio mercurii]